MSSLLDCSDTNRKLKHEVLKLEDRLKDVKKVCMHVYKYGFG